jgi:hypothetical protein
VETVEATTPAQDLSSQEAKPAGPPPDRVRIVSTPGI